MLNLTRCLPATALTLCLASGVAAAPADPGAEARTLWHQSIASGYQLLARHTQTLTQSARAYCDAPSASARETLEQAWLDGFLAWQQVRFVDFGPVEQDNRAWQFQFWPDAKNLVGRKAGYLLGSDTPLDGETLSGYGVAVQGFPMVEYLLFDEGLNSSDRALPGTRACTLLTGVSSHIAATARDLSDDWQAFREDYTGNELYTDTSIRSAMNALEVLEDRRLAAPMGLRGNGSRSPYRAEAWRSGKSLAAVQASMTGLQQYFLPAFSGLLEARGQSPLAADINAQTDEVLAHFPALDTPMAGLLTDDSKFRALQGLYVDVSQLVVQVNDQAAVALGVVRGFNSSDGD